MVAMVSAASAMMGAVFGSGSSSADAADADDADSAVVDADRIGHRLRPEWVPALLDFRRAMVRSPRRKKAPMAPGEAAAKGKQQAINQANAAKQQVRATAAARLRASLSPRL